MLILVYGFPMTDETQNNSKYRHLIIRHWQGEARLWQAYWLIGVAGGWVFWTLVLNLVQFDLLPDLAAALILLAYSLYAGVGIWRSAFNVNWQGWGYIARGIIVISAAGFIYELI